MPQLSGGNGAPNTPSRPRAPARLHRARAADAVRLRAPRLRGARPAPLDAAQGAAGPRRRERLTADIIELARQYGRYGYRKVAALLRSTAGWVVNDKRVERIWRREGLKVPPRQPKRGRLWLADGSCVRLRPSGRTTSGLTTSSRTAPTTGAGSGC
jgi:hypothetical protein